MKKWDLDGYDLDDFKLEDRYGVKYSLVSNRMFNLDRIDQIALVCKFKQIGSVVNAECYINNNLKIPWRSWIEQDLDDMSDEEIIREVFQSDALTQKCMNNAWIRIMTEEEKLAMEQEMENGDQEENPE